MRIGKEIFPMIVAGVIAGGFFYSCGQGKGSYQIDSLIEGYAQENYEESIGYQQDLELTEADEAAQTGSALSDDGGSQAMEAPALADSIVQMAESGGVVMNDGLRVRNLGRLVEVFNDSNYRQYAFAEKLGIDPIQTLSQAYYSKRPLVRVGSNGDYAVDELTHSLPFLVPEAANLLSAIGRNFQDSLKRKGRARYRIRATSLLRTPATVKKLKKVNINATDSSTHQFGTTFDISYHRFECLDRSHQVSEEALKNVLAEVLYDLRKEGRCLVKYEVKTGCFHVTATR